MPITEVLGFLLGLLVRQWRHFDEWRGGEEKGVTPQIFLIDFALRWIAGIIGAAALFVAPDQLAQLVKTTLGITELNTAGLAGGLAIGLVYDQFVLKLVQTSALPKKESVNPAVTVAKDAIVANLFASRAKAAAGDKDKIDDLISTLASFANDVISAGKLLSKSEVEAVTGLLSKAAGLSETFKVAGYNDRDRDRLLAMLKEIKDRFGLK